MFTSKSYTSSPVIVQSLMLSVRAFLRRRLRENIRCEQLTNILLNHDSNEVLLQGYSEHKLEQVLTDATRNNLSTLTVILGSSIVATVAQ